MGNPMIPPDDLQTAIALSIKYNVDQLYIADPENEPSDSDYTFAVKGIQDESFHTFHSELYMSLSKEVHQIDLSGEITRTKASS
jgi:hypothetical protein